MALFDPYTRLTNANAAALNGAKAYFYATGGLVLQSVYTTSALSVAHANPVVADAGGLFPAIYLDDSKTYRVIFKTSAGSTILDVDPVNTATATFTQSGSGASSRTFLAKARDVVHVRDFGAVGDNSTDDYTALANAISAASSAGAQLIFDGTKIYKINQDTLTFPTGMDIQTNGCTFNFTKGMGTGATPAISITGPFAADVIKATVPTSVRRNYGIIATGDDVSVGMISLVSTDQQAQLAAASDYGVKLASGTRFRVGKVVVTNFDRAVVIDTATESRVGGLEVTSYVRGAWVVSCTDLYVGRSHIQTRSANASQTAGHNSLLTTTCTNITYEDWVAEDAGEHGIRIGGGPQYNIRLVRPYVINSQGSGIKVLSTDNGVPVVGEFVENIFIIDPVLEDVGTGTGSGTNVCGILFERLIGGQIINPIIRKRNLTYSSVYGIHMFGVTDVVVSNPIIQDCQFSGIYLATEKSGAASADITNVQINGGSITDCSTHGIQISTTDSKTIRHLAIDGVKSYGNANRGISIGAGTGGAFVSCFCRAHLYQNVVDSLTCDSTAWLLDCFGVDSYGSGTGALSTIIASNSSRWSNETSFYVMKAGTWTAL